MPLDKASRRAYETSRARGSRSVSNDLKGALEKSITRLDATPLVSLVGRQRRHATAQLTSPSKWLYTTGWVSEQHGDEDDDEELEGRPEQAELTDEDFDAFAEMGMSEGMARFRSRRVSFTGAPAPDASTPRHMETASSKASVSRMSSPPKPTPASPLPSRPRSAAAGCGTTSPDAAASPRSKGGHPHSPRPGSASPRTSSAAAGACSRPTSAPVYAQRSKSKQPATHWRASPRHLTLGSRLEGPVVEQRLAAVAERCTSPLHWVRGDAPDDAKSDPNSSQNTSNSASPKRLREQQEAAARIFGKRTEAREAAQRAAAQKGGGWMLARGQDIDLLKFRAGHVDALGSATMLWASPRIASKAPPPASG